jgi:hypothetical protein
MEFFSKNARIAAEKVDEELNINPKAFMQEGEQELIRSAELEQHIIDRDHFKYDSKTDALLSKLERENFKKANDKELTSEEKLLVEMELQSTLAAEDKMI